MPTRVTQTEHEANVVAFPPPANRAPPSPVNEFPEGADISADSLYRTLRLPYFYSWAQYRTALWYLYAAAAWMIYYGDRGLLTREASDLWVDCTNYNMEHCSHPASPVPGAGDPPPIPSSRPLVAKAERVCRWSSEAQDRARETVEANRARRRAKLEKRVAAETERLLGFDPELRDAG